MRHAREAARPRPCRAAHADDGRSDGGGGAEFSDLDRIAVTVGTGHLHRRARRRGRGSRTGAGVGHGHGRRTTVSRSWRYQARSAAWGDPRRSSAGGGRRCPARQPICSTLRRRVERGWRSSMCFPPARPLLRSAPRPVVIVGSGAKTLARAVLAVGGGHADAETLLTGLQPDAALWLSLLADLAPSRPLRPLYLRPPDVKAQAARSLPRAIP